MEHLKSLGIETLTLDVQSESSITACVSKLTSLDILVNNAGALLTMPVVDISIPDAKELFDLNVWSYIAITQAFLPLLLKSPKGGMIVNQTSSAAVTILPFQSIYNASKAALVMFSDTLRLELQAFDIKVVDLRSGYVNTNIGKNHMENKQPQLPEGSIYEPAKEEAEKILRQEKLKGQGMEARKWAREVVRDLIKEKPPPVIWRGESAWIARIAAVLPFGLFDNMVKKMIGLDVVERMVREARGLK